MTKGPSELSFFETSPFSLVADPAAAQCWSGRKQIHQSLVELGKVLSRRADMSLDLIWANLGAGKTHTLYHLACMLQQEASSRTICSFIEMPEQLRSFVDVYKRIAAALPLDEVTNIITNCPAGKLPTNLYRAGNVLKHGGPAEKQIARAWFYAERPYLSELRKCSGINERIEDDAVAEDVLVGLVRAFEHAKCRLVVLIDEFQRIGVLKSAIRQRILSSLRTVFSRSPRHFSVIMAIQSRVEKSALELIPPELTTLMGRKPTISLPEMDVAEATEFVLGRFRFFRPAKYVGSETAPFQRETIGAVLDYMTAEAGIPLSPREILDAFAYVYDHSDDLQRGIAPEEAVRLLKGTYGAKRQAITAE